MIDGRDHEARIRQHGCGMLICPEPAGSPMRDDNERKLVPDNRAILRADHKAQIGSAKTDHATIDLGFLLGRGAWIPYGTGQCRTRSVGRHVEEPHAGRLGKRRREAKCSREYEPRWTHGGFRRGNLNPSISRCEKSMNREYGLVEPRRMHWPGVCHRGISTSKLASSETRQESRRHTVLSELRIRDATMADLPTIADIHASSWRAAYR